MAEPTELLDPDGEGIYLLATDRRFPSTLMRASVLFFGTLARWREIDTEYVYMRPSNDREAWFRASLGPLCWRLSLPRRKRPVLYAYCTPQAGAM
jgi:hypothetical protein